MTRIWLYINEKVELLLSGTKSKGVAAMGHTKLGQAKMARDTANSTCTLKLSLAHNCLIHFFHQQTIPIIYSPSSCPLKHCMHYLSQFIYHLSGTIAPRYCFIQLGTQSAEQNGCSASTYFEHSEKMTR